MTRGENSHNKVVSEDHQRKMALWGTKDPWRT